MYCQTGFTDGYSNAVKKKKKKKNDLKKHQLELVFVKHYAPNICLPLNMAKFAVS